MTKRIGRVTIIIVFYALIISGLPANDVVISPEIKKATRGTVPIFYLYEYENAFGEIVKEQVVASGIYIGKNRILSVYHIGNKRPGGGVFTVFLPDVGKVRKEVLSIKSFDAKTRLALFEFGGLPPVIRPIEIAEDIMLGEDVMIVGFSGLPNPRFSKLAYQEGSGILFYPGYYGDSGGGIFNMKGDLLGIINSFWDTKMSPTIGRAIPLEDIKKFLKEATK